MQIGIVGLGKMGFNFSLRLLEKGYKVAGFDSNPKPGEELAKQGGACVGSLKELCTKLTPPRTVLLSIPQEATEEVLFGENGLVNYLSSGDAVIDAANAYYKDSISHYERLKQEGIGYLDMGVSGGPAGARNGSSIMVGGEKEIYNKLERVFEDLAAPDGYAYVGPAGAGHFVKMVHNGIEYGMMQAIAEGFTVLKNAPFQLDLEKIAKVYNHGAVTESRLMGWLTQAFGEFGQNLSEVSGSVAQTGEGAWTSKTAKELGISVPIIDGSVKFRSDSEKNPSFTGKILTALRNQFGGHPIKEEQK
jgi:6-phosphogluconate dehydrogenase